MWFFTSQWGKGWGESKSSPCVRLDSFEAAFSFFFSFSFFLFSCISGVMLLLFMHCSLNSSCKCWLFFGEQCIHALFTDSQISFFSNFFIKNGSHGTIHTFKNYFATVLSIFSCIQTDPECNKLFSECKIFLGENFFGKEKEEQNNGVNCASLACLYY